MEDTEGAPDPLFGEMLLHNVVPSPSSLIQVVSDSEVAKSRYFEERIIVSMFYLFCQMSKEYLRGASPELPLGSSSASLSPDVQTGRMIHVMCSNQII